MKENRRDPFFLKKKKKKTKRKRERKKHKHRKMQCLLSVSYYVHICIHWFYLSNTDLLCAVTKKIHRVEENSILKYTLFAA